MGSPVEVADMASDVVPARASTDSIGARRWFRLILRTVLAVGAFLMLWPASDRLEDLVRGSAARFAFDTPLWLASISAAIVAGMLFGRAAWLPFSNVRFRPSRLLLALAALLPLAHFWWAFTERHWRSGSWLEAYHWFDGVNFQYVFAALAGVAVAACLAPASETPRTDQPL
jgi:hypothetical protein